jgi:AhpD family alkylhydroperoxidase
MSSLITDFREERERLNERILAKENSAAIMKRVYAMDTFAYLDRNEGLQPKAKEMLGLATSMVLRCDDCIKYHLENCFKLGIANDEMMDIFGIANVVGGTIVIPHTRRAIEYWELLNSERPTPSPFDKETKNQTYEDIIISLDSLLAGIDNAISKMATINEVLKSKIAYFYWVGFYLAEEKHLTVGPYQGTHGCLFIKYGEGVCGRAASTKQSIIVDDIQKLNEEQSSNKGALHITCDPRCNSEIVIPVIDKSNNLIGVLDIDSLHKNAFCEIDKEYLEKIIERYF